MALNIPMPTDMGTALRQGFETGGNFMQRILQNQLQREQQKLAEKRFQEELELRKQQLARSGANSDLQRQFLQEQVLAAQHANDPNYKFNQFLALQNKIMGGNGAPNPMQEVSPTEETGQGMGMFTPEGLGERQAQVQVQNQANQGQQGPGGLNLEVIKNNPILRGWFKHEFGYDPAEQTQAEKDQHELELLQKKEEIKKGIKNGPSGSVPLTKAMETKLQSVVTGVDNALPTLKELITDYKNLPKGYEFASPAQYAAYNAKANSIIEPLINAFGLNVTDATKQMMHDQVFRRTNEYLSSYRDRLVELAKDILRRRNDSFTSLKSGSINPKSEFSNEIFEGLKGNPKFADKSTDELINMVGANA